MVVIVPAESAQTVVNTLTNMGENVYAIGSVVAASSEARVIIDHDQSVWMD